MKKMMSFNYRSIIIFTFIIVVTFGIEIQVILNNNALMFLFPLIFSWGVYAGYKSLFSRCQITEDVLIVESDYFYNEKRKVQKEHYIRFSDVLDYRYELLPRNVDTNFTTIRLPSKIRNLYVGLYGSKPIRCITFYLRNQAKVCMIVSRYSKKQIEEIDDVLKQKITKTMDIEIEYNPVPTPQEARASIFKLILPWYIRLLVIMYFIIFISFAAYSLYLGGDATHGYHIGNDYYVTWGAKDTLVTYQEWISNYYLGRIYQITTAIFIPTIFVFYILDRYKVKRKG